MIPPNDGYSLVPSKAGSVFLSQCASPINLYLVGPFPLTPRRDDWILKKKHLALGRGGVGIKMLAQW